MNIKGVSKTQRKILKTSAIVATAIIPAAYMTKFHVDMFSKEDTKNRKILRNKMLGFFAGIGASVLLVHKNIKLGKNVILNKNPKPTVQALRIILAGIAPFAGLEISKFINKISST